MNKLEGFYELNKLQIPTVPWIEYTPETQFDDTLLWTVRVAVFVGDDFDLPRAVGVPSEMAKIKAEEFYRHYKENGMVIYYPFFIAEKSGVVEIRQESFIIEAVNKDLWNLTTEGRRDETVIIKSSVERHGTIGFVTEEELNEISNEIKKVKSKFREPLIEGKSVFLEWSYAKNVKKYTDEISPNYLVFYECKVL